jgi:DNA polymerase-3 subunit delta'
VSAIPPVLERMVGQRQAVLFLAASVPNPVHAYLFVGPPGTGRSEAAASFAACLFCPKGGCGSCPVCSEVLAGRHPDLVFVEREGASISRAQAREVVRLAARSPRVAPYQVLVLVDFHLLGAAVPSLLKTIEEPPETTIIIVTAESVPADFVTIASRCSRLDFSPLTPSDVAAALVAEGASPERADLAARAAGGRLDRARVLLDDEGLAARMERWHGIPSALNGTGAKAASLAIELVAAANEPVGVLEAQQERQLAELAEQAKAAGERGIPGRAEIEAQQRRERRRLRTDELRAGLARLGSVYRARLGADPRTARAAMVALEAIDEAASRLLLNVDETLLLEWLLLQLERAG